MPSLSEKELAVLKVLSGQLAVQEKAEEETEEASDTYALSLGIRDLCESFLKQDGTYVSRTYGFYASRELPVKFQEVDNTGKERGEQKAAQIQVILTQRSAYDPRMFKIRVYVDNLLYIPALQMGRGGWIPESLSLIERRKNLVFPYIRGSENDDYIREARFSDVDFWKKTAVDVLQASLPK